MSRREGKARTLEGGEISGSGGGREGRGVGGVIEELRVPASPLPRS